MCLLYLETRKFQIGSKSFRLKLLVLFLFLVLVPVYQILDFLVSFWYPFWSNSGLLGLVPVPGNPLLFVPKCTCSKVCMFQRTHVAKVTCCKVHMMLSACVAKCKN